MFWKLYFWSMVSIIFITNLHTLGDQSLYQLFELVVSLLALIGLYGNSHKKRIFNQKMRYGIFLLFVLTTLVTDKILINQLQLKIFHIVSAVALQTILIAPLVIGLYRYSFSDKRYSEKAT
ncbi:MULTISPECIES: hypothetical protein [Metabacillus]|uniref:hypothetical protein n=1 Tax=Metabacillus TaxID=2675233 RepID=UPI000C80CF90|nr:MULTISPECIES: hypothetical protein [Metabacillus]MCM3443286.1 hypothetical protein [Metabacillus halosaccharovorans]PMC34205.1 hypothetical protein CJ195_24090 [Bacillus sp. UMB0899]